MHSPHLGDGVSIKKFSDDLDLTRFKPGEVYFGCSIMNVSEKVKVIVEPYVTWIKVKNTPKRRLITRVREDRYLWIVKHRNDSKHPEY